MTTSVFGRVVAVAGAAVLASTMLQAQSRSPVADAAMAKNADTTRQLLKGGADANAAQGDGMTALHWAAMHGDGPLTEMLLVAGANAQATTRIGGFTPLHLASQNGRAAAIAPLLKGGAHVDARTSTGATPLMLAAASGNADVVTALAAGGADVNLAEAAHGQTALMFAASLGRTEAVAALLAKGAKTDVRSAVVDLKDVVVPEEALQEQLRLEQNARSAAAKNEGSSTTSAMPKPMPVSAPVAAAPATAKANEVAGVTRPFKYNELIGKHGGLTALHFAARQGATDTVHALVEAGAPIDELSSGDQTSPMLIAAVNGQYDLVKDFLGKGADPNLASDAGMTPLYAVLNVQWAPKAFYPQPRAYLQQEASYLEVMTALLDKGADPNARLQRKIWYTQYNFDLLRVDDSGATPFWRAAYASDIEAMKLLVARGADTAIPTVKPAVNDRFRQGGTRSTDENKDHSGMEPVPTGGPDIPPLLAASGAGYGEGFAGNAHRFAPTGMLAAVKYLIEELGTDPNVRDSDGNTAMHHAASRGDNEMINYLVSKGGDVTKVNRGGQTTVDMANGPVQRVQPYPETIKLLESLGAKNNHKCVSC